MKKLSLVMEMFILLFFAHVSFSFAEGIDVKSKTMIFDYQKKSSNSSSITSEATANLDNKIFISEKIKTEIPFTDIGIHWDAEYPEGSDLLIEIKTSKDGEFWTEWKKITIESYPNENSKKEYFSALINIEQSDRVHSYIQYRIEYIKNEKGEIPILKKLSFTFIDSEVTPNEMLLNIQKNMQQGSLELLQQDVSAVSFYSKPSVISRSGWGANESYMTWPPEYQSTTHNIIHHTDTPNTDTDWTARIRSIYYYHAITNGWGDIGYNYLVDPNGVLYEGRAGGDDVIAAHTYGYNDGTLGLGFLGSFGGGTYGGQTTPSSAMLTSAEKLLAWKCSQKNINPLGSGPDNDGANFMYISGHKDLTSTICPGNNLYDLIPTVRTAVNNLISGVNVTINTNSSGLQVTVDGAGYTSPKSFSWVVGDKHIISVSTNQYAPDGKTKYEYSSWSDGGSQSHTITVSAATTNYTASFNIKYLLDTNISPLGSGSISLNPSGGWYSPSQIVQVSTTQSSGYSFNIWSGDLSGASNPVSIIMNSPKNITANFITSNTNVTINTNPSGLQVTVDGAGYTSPKSFSWVVGDKHIISVSTNQYAPDGKTKYEYSSWSDGDSQSHTITVSAATTNYTASFNIKYLLDTNISPLGSGSISLYPSGGWYSANQIIQATATESSGYNFNNWGGDASGSSNPVSITINSPKNITGNFITSNTNVTINTSPSGLQIKIDGTDYISPKSFNWVVGEQHSITADNQYTQDGKTKYEYSSWSDGGTRSHSITISASTTNYMASFNTKYLLDTNINPLGSGSISLNPSGSWYSPGQIVKATATAVSGYNFSTWTGDISGSENPESVTMNNSKNITANFTYAPVGTTITTNPAGLQIYVDGTSYIAPQIFNWNVGTSHTINTFIGQYSYDQKTRYDYSLWSDNGAQSHQITISSDTKTYTASFLTKYLLDINVNPSNGGSITLTPTGSWYNPGTVVIATATPGSDYNFISWYGDISDSTNPASLLINNPKNITADFIKIADRYDTIAPKVSLTYPADKDENVAPNSCMSVVFSEQMDSSLFDTTMIIIQDDRNNNINGTVSYKGTTATFTPINTLEYYTNYTATVKKDVQDLSNNKMETDYTWNFTTSETSDTTAPSISLTSPNKNAENVTTNTSISVVFSEVVNANTVNANTFVVKDNNNDIVTGTISSTGITIIFTPSSNLLYNTTYTVTITSVEDLAGNSMITDYSWTFKTGDAPDTIAPNVSLTNPGKNAEDVAIDTKISASFSEVVNANAINTIIFKDSNNNNTIIGTVSYSDITATFTPASNLSYNTSYTVIITNVEDLAGNLMTNDYTWDFTTGDALDTAAPIVSLTNPSKNAENVAINTKISVSFSEVINANTINTNTFIVKDNNNNVVTGTISYSDLTIIFVPLSNLEYNITYTVIIKTQVADLSGNQMKDEYTWIFKTIVSSNSNNGKDSSDSKKKGPCLITNIATKISYGSIIINNLNKFRDEYLLNSLLGKWIVNKYYEVNLKIQ